MKVLQVNTVYGFGSTGKIVAAIQDTCFEQGIDCLASFSYYEKDQRHTEKAIPVSSWLDTHIHNRLALITMLQGCFSGLRTRLFLRRVKAYAPDIIHLHNIHGSFINHKLLFDYIKRNRIPVIWTLHDCWAFTGYCPHFDMCGCEKWQTQCVDCPNKHMYPQTLFDFSSLMFKLKKRWFTGVENLTLVTPSQWLADLTRQSFLKEYPVQVIQNGIDLSVFRPVESDFRARYQIPPEKKIVLGVAFGWGIRKGLDVFVELANRLDPSYQIVLVGTDDAVDRELPTRILSIHRTQNQRELAEIYTAADVFVNPTREDNFPTVNMEALACGTPVITFRAGGSPECVDETCGSVVSCDNTDSLEREIVRVCRERPFTREACRARAEQFDEKEKFREYVKLYESKKGNIV